MPSASPDIVSTITSLAGPRPRVLVAFSGGMDSTVLAHLLVKQRRRLGQLRLAHVDHGLQAASSEWSQQCAQLAQEWRVPIVSLSARITRGKNSPEAAARDARYELLAEAMEPGEVLVTAQHRDDQAETLLLQLLRGAGVAGLAAMPAFAAFGRGFIARPLLDMPRTQIETIARHARLSWIEDPSNEDPRFSRNYLRHRVMPLIREHWPGADKALTRSAAHMAEAAALLNERAAQDIARAADGVGLSVSALRALPLGRRRNALRAFIARHGVTMPEAARLREISGPLLGARVDAQPEVAWADARITRRSGRLELHESRLAPREFAAKSWRWNEDRQLILEDGVLELLADDSGPVDLALLPKVLELRVRGGGERLRPSARARTRTLKSLLQDAKVPVEERARLPLLFANDQLIAAGDRWIDTSVAATVKSRRRARLRWIRTR